MQEAPKERTTAVKATELASEARKMQRKVYLRAHEAKERGQKVAWQMGPPIPLLCNVMDVTWLSTEAYAALCAAKRASQPFLEKAESEGFTHTLCGYMRNVLGFSSLRQELGMVPTGAPEGGLAMPDMLLAAGVTCEPRIKHYQALARYMDVPLFAFDMVIPPFRPGDPDLEGAKQYYIKYFAAELRRLAAFLEEQTGKKLDLNRLWEYVRREQETHRYWWEVYQMRKAVPCPFPAQDAMSCITPVYWMQGEPETLDFHRRLRDEVRYRVENKIGAIPEERYRLFWLGGLPPWHTMALFNYFETHGAVSVLETAYYPGEPVDELDDPFDTLAWAELQRQSFASLSHTIGPPEILKWIEEYQIDGLVMHEMMSCHVLSSGLRYFREAALEHLKIPTLFIQGDIIDLRDYSDADTRANIDAFMETVAAYKASRR